MVIAGSEDVCSFTVDHVVAGKELLFGHAERDSADVFDEAQDGGRPEDVPARDEECADDSEGPELDI